MPRSSNAVNIRLISKISTLYYHYDLTQQQIANRLRLSRPKVSRLLKQAKELDIVQITVKTPEDDFVDLENYLENKFKLKEVIITEVDLPASSESDFMMKRRLGLAGANYLHRTVSEKDKIGVTWGTTLRQLVDMVQPKPMNDVHVVQTLGGVGPPEAKTHGTDISRSLSHLLNCKLTVLPAPGIVENIEAKKVLMSDRRVKSALKLFDQLNLAFVGIGAIETNPVLKENNIEISDSIREEIISSDSIGDIGLNFFDIEGKEVRTGLSELLLGISLDQLKSVDMVVGIAGGDKKFNSILGALRGEFINVLITDHITADKLAEI
jgi:deoxyribonucleoside regulator